MKGSYDPFFYDIFWFHVPKWVHLYFKFFSMETLNYEQQHIRTWLEDKTIINIRKLEDVSKIPRGTLKHFISERRSLPESHIDKVVNVIMQYGYVPMSQE